MGSQLEGTGKAWHQEPEAAGHTTPRKQGLVSVGARLDFSFKNATSVYFVRVCGGQGTSSGSWFLPFIMGAGFWCPAPMSGHWGL